MNKPIAPVMTLSDVAYARTLFEADWSYAANERDSAARVYSRAILKGDPDGVASLVLRRFEIADAVADRHARRRHR